MVYFTGNSLGLQPKSTEKYIKEELDAWSKYGVEGHFLAEKPWFSYHEFLTEKAAKVVGALPKEVVVTHSLTTNLHLLMVSFYRPNKETKRTKIICCHPMERFAATSPANKRKRSQHDQKRQSHHTSPCLCTSICNTNSG